MSSLGGVSLFISSALGNWFNVLLQKSLSLSYSLPLYTNTCRTHKSFTLLLYINNLNKKYQKSYHILKLCTKENNKFSQTRYTSISLTHIIQSLFIALLHLTAHSSVTSFFFMNKQGVSYSEIFKIMPL